MITISIPPWLQAQQLAFPGAEGQGRFTTGGRGGSVIEVTNLNDSGPGSLRAAVQASGTRTVVFRISGTIALNSDLRIQNGNITIAGQTAPGDGICIKNYPVMVDADNVIIRYIRFRLGDEKNVEADALGGRYHKNIIIDHCSASWSVDECVSFYQNENLTLQWCLISESLYESVHEKGIHGYGGIWGGYNCTFHHNLLAHHSSRNPRFASNDGTNPEGNVDSRNNVIYNWGGNSCYGGEGSTINLVANYYKYGPATGPKNRIAEPSVKANVPVGKWYIADNYVFGYPEITSDNWAGGVQGANTDGARASDLHPCAPVLTHSAEIAYELVLADAGAIRPVRDSLDARVVWETRNQVALYGASYGAETGIIDTPSDVGGWPVLDTCTPVTDADHDGIADDWETDNGLNPGNPADRNAIAPNGYTNLENYLNSLTFRDDYIVAPAQLTALTLSCSEILLDWKENSFDETGFKIERSAHDTTSFQEVTIVSPDVTTYTDGDLNEATHYFYRVSAVKNDIHSLYTNVADDKTIFADGKPLEPENPFPKDNSINIPIAVVLKWENGYGATSYDVYFGTSNPPTEFKGHQTKTYFDPHGLTDSTTYYWRVDAINEHGKTTGNTWRFTTEAFKEETRAFWDFNRGFGSLVLDVSGCGNHAILNNMNSSNWIDDGIMESALQFDGVDDYLEAEDDPSINFNIRGFTINCWLKKEQSESPMTLLSKAEYKNENFSSRYEIFSGEDGTMNFTVADSEKTSTLIVPGSGFYTNEWVMVTAVRERSENVLKLYLNNQLMGSAIDSSYNCSNEGSLLIGVNAEMTDFFTGQVDEFSLYNYALAESEIDALYKITSISRSEIVPQKLELLNYPNPFNNSSLVKYSVPHTSNVTLNLYNMIGQKVAGLVSEKKAKGIYTYMFETKDLSTGMYVFRLQAGKKFLQKKIVLVK